MSTPLASLAKSNQENSIKYQIVNYIVELHWIEKDKFGRPVANVSLTAANIERIHEALLTTIQNTQHPDESNIQEMKALEPKFLEIRDKMRPS